MPGKSISISMLILLTAAVLAAAVPTTPAGAQILSQQPDEILSSEIFTSLSRFHPGSEGYIAVRVDIHDPWHINSNMPIDDFLIPTELEIIAPEGIEIQRTVYPEPMIVMSEISDGEMSLFGGMVVFGAKLRIGEDVDPGSYKVTAKLTYQGCNDVTCLAPTSEVLETELVVGTLDEPAELLHAEIFASPPFTGISESGAGPETGDESVGNVIESRGMLLAFIFIFLGGLALNLTPCIYPIIPITVSYFGGQSGGKSSRAFLLSVLYVLGISLMYSTLGTIAATTGGLFGAALRNPIVVGFISLVLVALATSMFGLWEIRLPMFLTRSTGTARKGRLGALFMGLTVGIIAAPCIGPFVIGLLTYVGETGNPVLGFMMFFTLAWGMGVPFIVLGTVSGSISKLPRSGDWLVWVRKIFGFVLIAMALYFAKYLIGPKLTLAGYAITALSAGIYLGWIDRSSGSGRGFYVVRKVTGTVCLASALVVILLPGGPFRSHAEKPGIEWVPFSEERLREASDDGMPVMIDFYADWCIPCHELDHKSFSDGAVIDLSRRIVPLRVDMTRADELYNKIKEKYKIRGAPTIIFMDGSGREVPGSRITGFVGPDEIRSRLERISGE